MVYFMLTDILYSEVGVLEVSLQIYWEKWEKSFLRTAATSGKKILQSDLGKEILSDSLSSAATAAATALIENNPKEAREVMLKS